MIKTEKRVPLYFSMLLTVNQGVLTLIVMESYSNTSLYSVLCIRHTGPGFVCCASGNDDVIKRTV